jgi:hypothetical protein
MNVYYLREFRKAAFHTFKIMKRPDCYVILDKQLKGNSLCINKAYTLEEAKEKLKEHREEYIKMRLIDVQNEKKLSRL